LLTAQQTKTHVLCPYRTDSYAGQCQAGIRTRYIRIGSHRYRYLHPNIGEREWKLSLLPSTSLALFLSSFFYVFFHFHFFLCSYIYTYIFIFLFSSHFLSPCFVPLFLSLLFCLFPSVSVPSRFGIVCLPAPSGRRIQVQGRWQTTSVIGDESPWRGEQHHVTQAAVP